MTTSDVNVNDPAKVEAKNKNFPAGTDAGYCDGSAQGSFLVRLALGHPALPSTKPQPPPSLSFRVPEDEETHPAPTPNPSGNRTPPADPAPRAGQLFPSLNRQEGLKQKGIFHAYGYRWPGAMNCKGRTHLCPLQLPHSSKFCWESRALMDWNTELEGWICTGSIASKATELENTHIHQHGNAIKMCLAWRQQSHPGHSALHQFVINYPKTGLARNTPLLETQETFTSIFRWVPQTDIVTNCWLEAAQSCQFFHLLSWPSPGSFTKIFLQRITMHMTCNMYFQKRQYTTIQWFTLKMESYV